MTDIPTRTSDLQTRTTPASTVTRPTPASERTILIIVVMAYGLAAFVLAMFCFRPPPQPAFFYVGVALFLLLVIPGLIALSFASPWLGTETIEAGAGGVKFEHQGSGPTDPGPVQGDRP
jgi:hypothetical protein